MLNEEVKTLRNSLQKKSHEHSLAFVCGNGINRYLSNNSKSWISTLESLYKRYAAEENSHYNVEELLKGTSATEFFDLLGFKFNKTGKELHKDVVELFSTEMTTEEQQKYLSFQNCLKEWNSPILTTNFDLQLETGLKRRILKSEKRNFTDFYPWNVYRSDYELQNPINGFGIWHINGMVNYSRSIRFGLSDYMKLVAYTRAYLHNMNNEDTFNGKNQNFWLGYTTWLHAFMNCTLCIFGLSLDVNETYLRWMLIQRKEYFKKYPERSHEGFYLYVKRKDDIEMNEGKIYFLENVGIKPVALSSFDALYKDFLGYHSPLL